MKEVYDVLIAGSGVAGAYCALQFPPEVSVLVLSKYERTVCSSELAQGGVAAVLDFEDDSYELHANDTMIAGHFANDAESVDVLVHEGPDDVRRLMDMGVVFDRAPDGTLDKTLEGG
ncbi:MAG: FAD-binding protein, partial [Clostridia bacterium]|nr:FAD-binding protein [Clostridia bacterium]